MGGKTAHKQQKYTHKLAKSQRKLAGYLSLTARDSSGKKYITATKKQKKIEKYRLKIVKYQTKLASISGIESSLDFYNRQLRSTDRASNKRYGNLEIVNNLAAAELISEPTPSESALIATTEHRPFKSNPCKACPALSGKACLCAIKHQRRRAKAEHII